MEPKRYAEIQSELTGLNRKEEYQILLQTEEWQNFRESIYERDKRTCLKCGKKEGTIWEVIPYDDWKKLNDATNLEIFEFNVNYMRDVDKKVFSSVELDEYLKETQAQISVPKQKELGTVVLNAHHKYYLWSKLPWQYEMRDLETLCADCHKLTHLESKIYTFYDETKEEVLIEPICKRCDGEGYIERYQYYYDGICFGCHGEGVALTDNPKWIKMNKI